MNAKKGHTIVHREKDVIILLDHLNVSVSFQVLEFYN